MDNEPLRSASNNDHLEIVQYLVSAGANRAVIALGSRSAMYLEFLERVLAKNQNKAKKEIYFWWIPICYSLEHPSECGARMMQKNLEKVKEMGFKFKS
jgi:hypothetical protein